MSWEVSPEPVQEQDRAALIAAAEQALERDTESAWWRSGFEDDLGGGPAPKQAWRDAGVIEP